MFQGDNCLCAERQPGAAAKQSPPGPFRDLSTSARQLMSRVGGARRAGAADGKNLAGDDTNFCPRCGLLKSSPSRPGSITGYLFQDIRCKCAPDPAFAPGSMSRKLFKLKEMERGSTFDSSQDSADSTFINLAQGAIIGGAYKVKKLIGKGGMGEIYLADHLNLGIERALKLVPPDAVTEVGWMRFQQEARAVAKLNHKNVVQISDLGIHEGCLPFCAMEYVAGNNLAELLQKHGPMPLEKAIEIFKQICDGVEFAHRNGIIHRDLKPGNIMVTYATGRPTVKILDFGLAKLTQGDRHKQSLTAKGDIFGSPYYMSPEQCSGERVDNRSDLYSIGCTLFECLTGRPPFTGKLSGAIIFQQQEADAPQLSSVPGINRLPDAMEVVVAKSLRKNPVERYQTAGELKADLERIERGESVQPYYLGRDHASTPTVAAPAAKKSEQPPAAQSGYIWSFALGALSVALVFLVYRYLPQAYDWINKEAKNHKLSGAPTQAAKTAPPAKSPSEDSEKGSTTLPIDAAERSVSLDPTIRNDRKKFVFDGKSFFQGFTSVNGFRCRHYKIPPLDYHELGSDNIGRINVKLNNREQNILLRGEVDIPNSTETTYEPNDFILCHPNLLAGFRDGDYQSLRLVWLSDYANAPGAEFPEVFWKRRLDTISLCERPEGPIDHAETVLARTADRFSNFSRLCIALDLSSNGLSQLKCLMSIKRIELQYVRNINRYFQTLEKSPNLSSLAFYNCDYSGDQFEGLAKLAGLRSLKIGDLANNTITIARLKNICKLQRLEELALPQCHYSPATLEILNSLKSLKFFWLRFDKSWGPEQIKALKQALPNCKIWIRRTVNQDFEIETKIQ